MNLHIREPHYLLKLYEQDEIILIRVVRDVIDAMDIATTFCTSREPYASRTALVMLYDGEEPIEQWLFNNANEPTHKVF